MHLFRFSIFMWFIYGMRRIIWNILIDKSPPRRKSCFNYRNWHISISCEKCTVFWIYLLISVCMTDSVLWLFMLLAPFAVALCLTDIGFLSFATFIAMKKSEKLMCIPLTKSATFFSLQFSKRKIETHQNNYT